MGCPLTTGRMKIKYYSDIVNKVVARIIGWHTKLVFIGRRAILMRHVLLYLPMHLLAAINLSKKTLELIEKLVARFFGQEKIMVINIIGKHGRAIVTPTTKEVSISEA